MLYILILQLYIVQINKTKYLGYNSHRGEFNERYR